MTSDAERPAATSGDLHRTIPRRSVLTGSVVAPGAAALGIAALALPAAAAAASGPVPTLVDGTVAGAFRRTGDVGGVATTYLVLTQTGAAGADSVYDVDLASPLTDVDGVVVAGGGGGAQGSGKTAGRPGGSGGGGGGYVGDTTGASYAGGTGTTGQGSAGAAANVSRTGGGGGAGQAAGVQNTRRARHTGNPTARNVDGDDGLDLTAWCEAARSLGGPEVGELDATTGTYHLAGGGGGLDNTVGNINSCGLPGLGGGRGGYAPVKELATETIQDGLAHTGGGGGGLQRFSSGGATGVDGGASGGRGGHGGSGVVMLRWPTAGNTFPTVTRVS